MSESSSLNNENANSSLVLFRKDHNSNITNGKEIGTKNTWLIPNIVYLRRNTTQRKESVDLLHYHESTNLPGNTFLKPTQPVQSTSGLNPKSMSPRSKSSESTDSNIPIVVCKDVRSCTKHPLSKCHTKISHPIFMFSPHKCLVWRFQKVCGVLYRFLSGRRLFLRK